MRMRLGRWRRRRAPAAQGAASC
uniref:Uncharacterized protein n=1 Tax=Arundo donax TaxID=35708 RepID=A0A0A9BAI7_ARUDO